MTKIKLSYLDINGGLGESIRLALTLGNIVFEDDRISFADFPERRASFPFQSVPVAEIGGQVFTQSNALLRYFGRQANLYPDDIEQALRCDEMMDAVDDLSNHAGKTFGLEGEAMVEARRTLVDEKFKVYLKIFEARLGETPGDFVTGEKMSVADLKLFVWVSSIERGVLDHVPVTLVDKVAPKVAKLAKRVASHDVIAAYYKARA